MSPRTRSHARLWLRGLAGLALLLVLAACGSGGGTPPATPSVSSTTPADSATNVGVGTNITVAFSEAMNQSSVESAFSIDNGATCSFSWNGAGDEVTCDPDSDLATSTEYTVTIGSGAESTEGASLGSAHSFKFTTAAGAAPTVTSTTPADSATGVALNSNIKIAFSQAMNKTATQGAVSISPSVSCTFLWNAADDTLTCQPDSNFSSSTSYTVTVGTDAENAAGVALASSASFSFTTGTTALSDCELGTSQLGNCVLN